MRVLHDDKDNGTNIGFAALGLKRVRNLRKMREVRTTRMKSSIKSPQPSLHLWMQKCCSPLAGFYWYTHNGHMNQVAFFGQKECIHKLDVTRDFHQPVASFPVLPVSF